MFLLLEFFVMFGGASVSFKHINIWQSLLHFIGFLSMVWMILDRWSYAQMYIIAFVAGSR